MPPSQSSTSPILIGPDGLSLEEFCDIVLHDKPIALSDKKEYLQHLQRGSDYITGLSQSDKTIYGVNTGFGESCSVEIKGDGVENLPLYLARFHGCGMGKNFSERQCKAILLARIASLAKGYSGLRPEVLQRLIDFLNWGWSPRIPEEGSVGASGDLTPLSYIAACLMGERDVYFRGELQPIAELYQKNKLSPLKLRPKETLGIMNGTSAMTAIAALCYQRAEYLARLCCRITAMGLIGLRGNRNHFLPELFKLKPHPGQTQAAAWIFEDLNIDNPSIFNPSRVQERYSYRCSPHIIGVLIDALPWMKNSIEIELNSVNDNPIIDPEAESIYHGGHFYGGHIAFAMDSLKNLVANQADLLDRQMAILVNYRSNNGLPKNLSGAQGAQAEIHHGFKAVQIGLSAFTAEALKLTLPASVFSRSTECHNQDKVSMGTHSARDCWRVLELTEQVAAGMLLASHQAIQLRIKQKEFSLEDLNTNWESFFEQLKPFCPFVEKDIELEQVLRNLQTAISKKVFKWT
jgi:histidine ammonia-lyase